MQTYVYIRSEPGLFTVGHFDPSGNWHSDSDHSEREDAAARVAYLHGAGAMSVEYVLLMRAVELVSELSAKRGELLAVQKHDITNWMRDAKRVLDERRN
jgi:hypothetical protein